MNKTIKNIITETVHKALLEYAQPSFSINTFKQIADSGDLTALLKYCEKNLQEHVGEGQGRTVFDYMDDTVLKIAHPQDSERLIGLGEKQNKNEYEASKIFNYNPLVPKVYDADTNAFTWILSESVLPVKEEDFKKILGIPYGNDGMWRSSKPEDRWDYSEYPDEEQPFDKPEDDTDGEISFMGFMAWYADYEADFLDDWTEYECDQYYKLMQSEWFRNLIELFEIQDPSEFYLPNFGIAMRNGKPTIVVLDLGWDGD